MHSEDEEVEDGVSSDIDFDLNNEENFDIYRQRYLESCQEEDFDLLQEELDTAFNVEREGLGSDDDTDEDDDDVYDSDIDNLDDDDDECDPADPIDVVPSNDEDDITFMANHIYDHIMHDKNTTIDVRNTFSSSDAIEHCLRDYKFFISPQLIALISSPLPPSRSDWLSLKQHSNIDPR